MPALGISLFLIAAGAILAFGVVDTAPGIDVAAVGFILMIVGFVGLAMTLAFWSSFSPFASSAPFRRTRVSGPAYRDEHVVIEREPRRTVVIREEPETIVSREQPVTRERIIVREPDERV